MLELQILFILTCMLLIPGWFVLAITGIWREWPGLQMWIVAVGIGISFYPVLFYGTRLLLPFVTFGPYKLATLLFLFFGVTVWLFRREWRNIFSFQPLEWLALGVFALTLGTRFWIIREQPFPAWTDSLHHTLLTQLTAVQGQLPRTLDPYFPVPLDQYHLGLYGITAALQWLAQVPAYTALLWTAQVLNGLAGIGVYLVLDRKVGRVGAIVGAVVVGLLSQQPAIYVNWGRFTQLSSQVLLLIGWLVVWETIERWVVWDRATQLVDQSGTNSEDVTIEKEDGFPLHYLRHNGSDLFSHSVIAALLTAAIFLLHFRVAAFYIPLLALSSVSILWRVRSDLWAFRRALLGTLLIAALSLLLVLPALIDALNYYIAERLAIAARQASQGVTSISPVYQFPISSFSFLIGVPWWFLGVSIVGALFGLLRRNIIAVQMLLWVLVLLALGYTYLLRIPMLNLTNLGAILIMYYLPIGLIIGSAIEEVATIFRWRKVIAHGLLAIFLVAGLVAARDRSTMIEPYRYLVTPADVAAMQWINENVHGNALFAVNTHFWLPYAPHGTDGGFWIPYFTGHPTTTGVMINDLAPPAYRTEIVETSRLVKQLEEEPTALLELRQRGINYIYIGAMGNAASGGLNPQKLGMTAGLKEVYANGGVHIFYLTEDGIQ